MQTCSMETVVFTSSGNRLAGNLFLPAGYENGQQYPAIVVSGSWTTVKEQMAGLYAERLAEKGFISLAFDFSNYGESEGQPEEVAIAIEQAAGWFNKHLSGVHQ